MEFAFASLSLCERKGWPRGLLSENGGASNKVEAMMRKDLSLSWRQEKRVEKRKGWGERAVQLPCGLLEITGMVWLFFCCLICFIFIVLWKVGSFHSILESPLELSESLNLLLSEKVFYFLGNVLKFLSFLNTSYLSFSTPHEISNVSVTRRVKTPFHPP